MIAEVSPNGKQLLKNKEKKKRGREGSANLVNATPPSARSSSVTKKVRAVSKQLTGNRIDEKNPPVVPYYART